MKKITRILQWGLMIVLGGQLSLAQQTNVPHSLQERMQWFQDAKLGVFIHWGIYAVKGVDESWSFYNKKISYKDYMSQLNGFTASKYNPEEWAALIKESGAGYAVLTTKHHDGVALWPTKENHYSVVKNAPAKRDLLKPFFQALDKYGIKRGAYFSLIDWSHPDYPAITRDSNRYKMENDPARWQRFQKFLHAQIAELNTNYKPDLWWFDGEWEHNAKEWQAEKINASIFQANPWAISNDRLQDFGNYETYEQTIPPTKPKKFPYWEACMTSNLNWGYHPDDTNYKTPYQVISIFADVISNGGVYLFDIGPKEDGTIPTEQVHLLKELGKWNKKHKEAIFGTLAGIEAGHFYGPTTIAKDSTTLYLFLQPNTSGQVMLKGLDNTIKKIRVVGTNHLLTHQVQSKMTWGNVPGIVYINIPAEVNDQYMTVLALELDKPLKMYKSDGEK